MVEASQSNAQLESIAGATDFAPQSDFKVYLDAHPEMTGELLKVIVQMY